MLRNTLGGVDADERASLMSKSRIKRLRGMRHPEYRLRVDEIRVFYDVTDDAVEILAIVPKSEAAAWLERYGKQDDEQSKPDEGHER